MEQAICAVFVEQYYHILHETPDQAYKFYQERSTIGRQGPDGVMEYVTTLPEINKKLISMDFGNYLTDINTADAVSSHNGGTLIVVTGSLTAGGGVWQNFTQSFLAPQEGGGIFILSDIFRIMPKTSPLVINQSDSQTNDIKRNVGSIDESREAERVETDHVTTENKVEELKVSNPTANATTYESCDDSEPPVHVTKEDLNGIHVASPPQPQSQKDATSRSYASVVRS
ncbi:hypothetical protein ZWY2020_000734 [Hordeum vulgare]|nr:hypothetical protein ZWY2020_000734 [Hordeum vulgare]